MFLCNCWYVAGWSHDIVAGSLVSRRILGEPIVLYRKADGSVAALEDRCCHRLAPLSRGRIEGDDLRCMYHGLKFAPSGKCVEVPGQDLIPSTAVVGSYPVIEEDCWDLAVDGRLGVSRPGADPQSIEPQRSRLVHADRAAGL
jgi:vanillate O-demethylase monooxygenase subunit